MGLAVGQLGGVELLVEVDERADLGLAGDEDEGDLVGFEARHVVRGSDQVVQEVGVLDAQHDEATVLGQHADKAVVLGLGQGDVAAHLARLPLVAAVDRAGDDERARLVGAVCDLGEVTGPQRAVEADERSPGVEVEDVEHEVGDREPGGLVDLGEVEVGDVALEQRAVGQDLRRDAKLQGCRVGRLLLVLDLAEAPAQGTEHDVRALVVQVLHAARGHVDLGVAVAADLDSDDRRDCDSRDETDDEEFDDRLTIHRFHLAPSCARISLGMLSERVV